MFPLFQLSSRIVYVSTSTLENVLLDNYFSFQMSFRGGGSTPKSTSSSSSGSGVECLNLTLYGAPAPRTLRCYGIGRRRRPPYKGKQPPSPPGTPISPLNLSFLDSDRSSCDQSLDDSVRVSPENWSHRTINDEVEDPCVVVPDDHPRHDSLETVAVEDNQPGKSSNACATSHRSGQSSSYSTISEHTASDTYSSFESPPGEVSENNCEPTCNKSSQEDIKICTTTAKDSAGDETVNRSTDYKVSDFKKEGTTASEFIVSNEIHVAHSCNELEISVYSKDLTITSGNDKCLDIPTSTAKTKIISDDESGSETPSPASNSCNLYYSTESAERLTRNSDSGDSSYESSAQGSINEAYQQICPTCSGNGILDRNEFPWTDEEREAGTCGGNHYVGISPSPTVVMSVEELRKAAIHASQLAQLLENAILDSCKQFDNTSVFHNTEDQSILEHKSPVQCDGGIFKKFLRDASKGTQAEVPFPGNNCTCQDHKVLILSNDILKQQRALLKPLQAQVPSRKRTSHGVDNILKNVLELRRMAVEPNEDVTFCGRSISEWPCEDDATQPSTSKGD